MTDWKFLKIENKNSGPLAQKFLCEKYCFRITLMKVFCGQSLFILLAYFEY